MQLHDNYTSPRQNYTSHLHQRYHPPLLVSSEHTCGTPPPTSAISQQQTKPMTERTAAAATAAAFTRSQHSMCACVGLLPPRARRVEARVGASRLEKAAAMRIAELEATGSPVVKGVAHRSGVRESASCKRTSTSWWCYCASHLRCLAAHAAGCTAGWASSTGRVTRRASLIRAGSQAVSLLQSLSVPVNRGYSRHRRSTPLSSSLLC